MIRITILVCTRPQGLISLKNVNQRPYLANFWKDPPTPGGVWFKHVPNQKNESGSGSRPEVAKIRSLQTAPVSVVKQSRGFSMHSQAHPSPTGLELMGLQASIRLFLISLRPTSASPFLSEISPMVIGSSGDLRISTRCYRFVICIF